jgi:SAM-dependent methyltransferase
MGTAAFDQEGDNQADLGHVAAVEATNSLSVHSKPMADEASPPRSAPKRPEPLTRPFPAGSNPSRRDKILANLELSKLQGLEIGALASPLISPTEGAITFVDHTDTESLRDKYRNDPSVNVDEIVNVSAVWGTKTLPECIGAENKFDYVVASHVIEHAPDLVTWLSEIRSVLKPNGCLRLAVPDRRYTFDYLRNESRIYDVLDAYVRRARAPLPRVIIENHKLSVEVDAIAAWAGTLDTGSLRHYNTIENGFAVARDVLANGIYHDTHCWVFTPLTFAELCVDMAELNLLDFACDYYIDTEFNNIEFIVGMVPCDNKRTIIDSWTRMKNTVIVSNPSLDVRSERLQNERDAALAELERLRTERDAAQSELAELRASASFRVSAGLGALRRVLRATLQR